MLTNVLFCVDRRYTLIHLSLFLLLMTAMFKKARFDEAEAALSGAMTWVSSLPLILGGLMIVYPLVDFVVTKVKEKRTGAARKALRDKRMTEFDRRVGRGVGGSSAVLKADETAGDMGDTGSGKLDNDFDLFSADASGQQTSSTDHGVLLAGPASHNAINREKLAKTKRKAKKRSKKSLRHGRVGSTPSIDDGETERGSQKIQGAHQQSIDSDDRWLSALVATHDFRLQTLRGPTGEPLKVKLVKFNRGDRLVGIRRLNDLWWVGYSRRNTLWVGLIPANHVIADSASPVQSKTSAQIRKKTTQRPKKLVESGMPEKSFSNYPGGQGRNDPKVDDNDEAKDADASGTGDDSPNQGQAEREKPGTSKRSVSRRSIAPVAGLKTRVPRSRTNQQPRHGFSGLNPAKLRVKTKKLEKSKAAKATTTSAPEFGVELGHDAKKSEEDAAGHVGEVSSMRWQRPDLRSGLKQKSPLNPLKRPWHLERAEEHASAALVLKTKQMPSRKMGGLQDRGSVPDLSRDVENPDMDEKNARGDEVPTLSGDLANPKPKRAAVTPVLGLKVRRPRSALNARATTGGLTAPCDPGLPFPLQRKPARHDFIGSKLNSETDTSSSREVDSTHGSGGPSKETLPEDFQPSTAAEESEREEHVDAVEVERGSPLRLKSKSRRGRSGIAASASTLAAAHSFKGLNLKVKARSPNARTHSARLDSDGSNVVIEVESHNLPTVERNATPAELPSAAHTNNESFTPRVLMKREKKRYVF